MTSARQAELRPALPARGRGDDRPATGGTAAAGASVPPVGASAPLHDFGHAAAAVLDHLAATVPLPTWFLARVDGDEGVVLASSGAPAELAPGATFRSADSLAARILAQGGVAVADASASDAAVAAATPGGAPVGAYLGVPLRRPDGTCFGVLAGFGPEPVGSELETSVVELLARLLAGLLAVVVQAEADAREHDRADATEMHDGVTGLGDRRYFEQVLVAEESRCRRYGDRAAIVIVDLDDHDFVAAAEGPAAAQVLLRRAARVLRTESRDEDLVARVSEGTFAILSVGADADGAATFAARLEEALVGNEVRASIRFRARDPRLGLDAAFEATLPAPDPVDPHRPA